VEIREHVSGEIPPRESWALGCMGERGGKRSILKSLYLNPEDLEQHNIKLQKKYREMEKEVRFEAYLCKDAEILLSAFGTTARIARSAINNLRNEGIKVGMLRPITLFPFPSRKLAELASGTKHVLVVEMNMGQMVEDVEAAVCGKAKVSFFGHAGGIAPSVREIEDRIRAIL